MLHSAHVTYRAALWQSRLPRLEQDFLCTRLKRSSRDPNARVDGGDLLVFFLARYFAQKHPVITANQWPTFFDAAAAAIQDYGDAAAAAASNADPTQARPMQITIVDQKFFTWTGAASFINLNTGQAVEQLPQPGLEVVSINLFALLVKAFEFCRTATAIMDRTSPSRKD